MKFQLFEEYLFEQTYGLTEKPLSFDAMLNVALGWRMLSILTSPNKVFPQGFSIQSNVRGQGGNDPAKILHHIFGDWKFEEVAAVSVRDHTKIHNTIRKLIKEALPDLSNIRNAYNEYVKAYAEPFNYDTVGKRLEAYEEFFRRVANSLSQDAFKDRIKQIYIDTYSKYGDNK